MTTSRPRWLPWLAALLLAGCLVLFDVYWHLRDSGASARQAMLSAMPPDARAVLFADFTELRRSPFAAQLYTWIPRAQADADYAAFLRATGFDYERDLDRIAVAVLNSPPQTHLLAIVDGRFDRKKITAYASASGARENRAGREFLSVPLEGDARKLSFTFLTKDRIALTDAPDLAPLLATPPDTSDSRDWRDRITRVAGSPVFAILRQDAAAGAALASRAPGGLQSPQLSALLDQLLWISLAARPEAASLRIIAEGESGDEQTSRQLSDLLSGLLVLARAGLNGPQTRQQLDPQIRDAYLEMLQSADVSRINRGETKSVRLVFDVTWKFLSAVSTFVPAHPAPADPPVPAKPAPKPPSGRKPARKAASP